MNQTINATMMLAGLAAAGALPASQARAAEPPPVEYFMRHAAYSDALISPDGRHLAISVDRGDQDVLTVLRMSDLSIVKVNVLPDEKSVAGFRWISDDRLMFTAIRKVGGFAQPAPTGEWYAVNADGSKPEAVIFYGSRGTTERGKTVGMASFSLLDPLLDSPREVLMSRNYPRSQSGAGTQLVRVDTFTGTRKEGVRAPAENCSISVDQKKEARWAQCYRDEDEAGQYDTRTELWRRGEDGKWVQVDAQGGDELMIVRVADTGTVYAERAPTDGSPQAFGTLDPVTGAFTELFRDPVAEPESVIWSPVDKTALAVATFAGAPRVEIVAPDHPDAKIYESLSAAFPGQLVTFDSATRDGSKIIVSVQSDRNPGELYLYDRATGNARFLLKRRAWVDSSTAATVRPFSFKARDGLTLHGYLTIPRGADPKNLPLIVNPHGGPMGPRDYWFYNPETQLFASRGFATLQVNYRGSGGFGKAFRDKAYGAWGGPLMDDIVDATKWAVEQGIAAEDRVCIYGGSFGGYAAMMAPARAQGLYSCAFGYVGMYDAQIQFRRSDTGDRDAGIRYLQRAFGKTRAEQDQMSPVTHAAKLDLPVFLAAGARDPRCPPEHTEEMAEALTRAGNPPEGVIIQSGEMHGFYDVDNRVNLYTQMLAFFSRHIGGSVDVGQVKPAGSP